MDFAIHAGPVASADLAAALASARDHWVATHSEHTDDASLAALDQAIATAATPELRASLTAARATHVTKQTQSPEVVAAVALMNEGISKASLTAPKGAVCASVTGLVATGREDKVARRLSVAVDESEPSA